MRKSVEHGNAGTHRRLVHDRARGDTPERPAPGREALPRDGQPTVAELHRDFRECHERRHAADVAALEATGPVEAERYATLRDTLLAEEDRILERIASATGETPLDAQICLELGFHAQGVLPQKHMPALVTELDSLALALMRNAYETLKCIPPD